MKGLSLFDKYQIYRIHGRILSKNRKRCTAHPVVKPEVSLAIEALSLEPYGALGYTVALHISQVGQSHLSGACSSYKLVPDLD